VKINRDLENQIRGLLKNLGRLIGRAKFNGFAAGAAELIEDRPERDGLCGRQGSVPGLLLTGTPVVCIRPCQFGAATHGTLPSCL
jgi:hypothetical protein